MTHLKEAMKSLPSNYPNSEVAGSNPANVIDIVDQLDRSPSKIRLFTFLKFIGYDMASF